MRDKRKMFIDLRLYGLQRLSGWRISTILDKDKDPP